jgi:ribosomal protein S18 acetylase RimI-like enzyme
MNLAYYKRYRMEIDLTRHELIPSPVPNGYLFVPWEPALLDAFSQAKYLSFRNEMDSKVFPCLGEFEGCRRLMAEIARKPGFLPGATWLIVHAPAKDARQTYCGTVQGIRDQHGFGAIQNIGVTPEHRCFGLGTGLLVHALYGFRQAGIRRAYLEVTAQNDGAIRLYRRVGFAAVKTVYKAVEAEYSK